MSHEDGQVRLWGTAADARADGPVAGTDAPARAERAAPSVAGEDSIVEGDTAHLRGAPVDSLGRPVTACCGALILGRPFECVCEYDAFRREGGVR